MSSQLDRLQAAVKQLLIDINELELANYDDHIHPFVANGPQEYGLLDKDLEPVSSFENAPLVRVSWDDSDEGVPEGCVHYTYRLPDDGRGVTIKDTATITPYSLAHTSTT